MPFGGPGGHFWAPKRLERPSKTYVKFAFIFGGLLAPKLDPKSMKQEGRHLQAFSTRFLSCSGGFDRCPTPNPIAIYSTSAGSAFFAISEKVPKMTAQKYGKLVPKSSGNHSKIHKKHGWRTVQKKTQKRLPLGSFWAPVWHARRALGLTWGALWPPLHIQIWPLLPSVRSFAPQTPKRRQNNTKMSPK